MKTPLGSSALRTNAAILLWQSRFRLLLIIAVGGITLGLNWAGALSLDSVVASRVGVDRALTWFIALGLSYFIFVGALALYLRARNRVGRWALPTVLIADVITFNGSVFLATPPDWYERALILSTFTLLLALLYSGWRAAMLNLLCLVAAYLGLLFGAEQLGASIDMNESLWTLGVFTVAMSAFVMLHADLSARLSMIVRVFDRAREGVFSLSFDERSGDEPDGITVIGQSYDRMRKSLTSLILTDPLTQCFNPRGFEQLAAREIVRAARADVGLIMLAIDLDHFKSINDTYGHMVGDDVLRDIGAVLRNTARRIDIVARVGGEEFTILAATDRRDGDTTHADEKGGMMFAQRLLDACRKHSFDVLGGKPVTISIGVAALRARTPEVLQTLRARADEALYAAKHGGRNRAMLWVEAGSDGAMVARAATTEEREIRPSAQVPGNAS